MGCDGLLWQSPKWDGGHMSDKLLPYLEGRCKNSPVVTREQWQSCPPLPSLFVQEVYPIGFRMSQKCAFLNPRHIPSITVIRTALPYLGAPFPYRASHLLPTNDAQKTRCFGWHCAECMHRRECLYVSAYHA